jgi:hypothetical protein
MEALSMNPEPAADNSRPSMTASALKHFQNQREKRETDRESEAGSYREENVVDPEMRDREIKGRLRGGARVGLRGGGGEGVVDGSESGGLEENFPGGRDGLVVDDDEEGSTTSSHTDGEASYSSTSPHFECGDTPIQPPAPAETVSKPDVWSSETLFPRPTEPVDALMAAASTTLAENAAAGRDKKPPVAVPAPLRPRNPYRAMNEMLPGLKTPKIVPVASSVVEARGVQSALRSSVGAPTKSLWHEMQTGHQMPQEERKVDREVDRKEGKGKGPITKRMMKANVE